MLEPKAASSLTPLGEISGIHSRDQERKLQVRGARMSNDAGAAAKVGVSVQIPVKGKVTLWIRNAAHASPPIFALCIRPLIL